MKNNERLYVDVHVLQTVPPSCVNRDDTGSPKTGRIRRCNKSACIISKLEARNATDV